MNETGTKLDAEGFPEPTSVTVAELEAAGEKQKLPWEAGVQESKVLPVPEVIGGAEAQAPTPVAVPRKYTWADFAKKTGPTADIVDVDPATIPMRPSSAGLPAPVLPPVEPYTEPREPEFMNVADEAFICSGRGDPNRMCKYYFERRLPAQVMNANRVLIQIERYCLRLMPAEVLRMEDRAALECTEYEPRTQ